MPGDERVAAPEDTSIDDRERLLQPGWPTMAFIEKRLADDETNWWAPNAACVEAMVRSTGLTIDAHPAHEIWLCSPSVRA
jgi:tRNA (mo5U34)-methyltransferase